MRLLTRLLLYVLAPFLIGSGVVLYMVGNRLETLMRAEIVGVTTQTLLLRSNAIDAEIAAIGRNLRLIANSEILRQPRSKSLQAQIAKWEEDIPGIDGLYVTNTLGQLFSERGRIPHVDIRDREYFTHIRQGQYFLSKPVVSRDTGTPVVVTGVPILDERKQVLGSAFATVAIDYLTARVRELQPKSGGVAILTDSQGVVLAGHPDEPDITGLLPDPAKNPKTAAIARTLTSAESSPARIVAAENQEPWQVIHMTLPHTGWKLGLAYPEKSFFSVIDNIWQIGARIVLFLAFAVLLAVALLNRSLLRPITRLAVAQQKLEEGDFTIRTASKRQDELGDLSRAFDRMAERLDQALGEARNNERRFRTIFENAHDAIFIMDGDRFVACNPATEQFFGYPRSVLLKTGPVTLSPPQQANGRSSRELGEKFITAALNGTPQRFDWIHRNAEGRNFEVEVSLQRIEIDGKVMMQAILRDLFDRQRAEVLEEKFRRVFEASPDYMIVARLEDGLIIEANEGFEHVTGIRISEALGHRVTDLGFICNPGGRTRMVELLNQQGYVRDLSMQVRHRNGTIRETSVSAATFMFDNVPHYVSIARDITDTTATYRALQASEARLKAILEAAPTPICINRLADFSYISVNPAWENLYGFSAAETIGSNFHKLGLRSTNFAQLKRQTEQLLAEGRLDGAETEFIHPTGKHISIIYSSRIIDLDDEQVMVSINADVTRLKETEKRLKTILDFAPAIFVIFSLPDFTFREVNHEFEKLFGVKTADIRGLTPMQAGLIAVDPGVIKWQTEHLLADGRIDNAEISYQTPDGRIISIIYSSRVLELDGIPSVLSMATDISLQKIAEEVLIQAQQELKESEARFSALFQSSPVPMSVIVERDGDFRVEQLNDAFFRTFQFKPEEVIGKTSAEFRFAVNSEDRQNIYQILEHEGEAHNFESLLRRAEDSPILCLVSAHLIRIGRQRLVIVGYQDITKQREIEEALRNFNTSLESRIQERTHELQRAQAELMRSEKLAALGSLVAGVAHELNTPIGNSLTVATTLTDRTRKINEALGSGMRRSTLETYLADATSGTAILTRNLQRAAELIQSFKSIAVDQSSNHRRKFNLQQIIDETLVALRPSLKKKPYTLAMEVDPDITLDSYPGPLEQIIVNLINNAIFHGLEGRSEGCVTVRAIRLKDDNARIEVRDDGCGITPANLARVFDPFFTTKLGKGGSGLGLHIVRNIVEDVLGGRIHAESAPGKGTAMIVEIPLCSPELKMDSTAQET